MRAFETLPVSRLPSLQLALSHANLMTSSLNVFLLVCLFVCLHSVSFPSLTLFFVVVSDYPFDQLMD